jgi:phenylacetic acid degradation operon negative regulatory protein
VTAEHVVGEPQPYTPGSLILSFYGAYGRSELGGDVPVSVLIRTMAAAGADAPSVRSAVSRLKRRGLLVPTRTGGAAAYGLSADARQLLADGDGRIYGGGTREEGDWLLVVFSVPESQRQKRHVLRSRLAGLGFGSAAPGVWIAPGALYEETRHALDRLGLASYVDLFRGAHAGFTPTAQAVRRWWDLDALAALHRGFLAAHEPVLERWEAAAGAGAGGAGTRDGDADGAETRGADADGAGTRGADGRGAEAFADYLRALDSWRRLPYADPGLPAALLPDGWPGFRSAAVFGRLHELLRDRGAAYVREQARGQARAA